MYSIYAYVQLLTLDMSIELSYRCNFVFVRSRHPARKSLCRFDDHSHHSLINNGGMDLLYSCIIVLTGDELKV